jgi:hypothetical protein
MTKNIEPVTRKTVTLPDSMWREIERYRIQERISTEAGAIRYLIQHALRRLLKDTRS